jgi:hypothetical protein
LERVVEAPRGDELVVRALLHDLAARHHEDLGAGPGKRAMGLGTRWDVQFPQQAAGQKWTPAMMDYFYATYTNIIAFSPTDTMP